MIKRDKRNIEHEVKYNKTINNDILNKLDSNPSSNIKNDHTRMMLTRENGVVKKYDYSTYKIPDNAKRFLGNLLFNEIQDLLFEIKRINDENAGFEMDFLHVQMNGHTDVLTLRKNLRDWADRYCISRLSKPNNKDKHVFSKFLRIYHELLPFIDNVNSMNDSLHGMLLSEITEYIPHKLYDNTWAPLIKYHKRNDDQISIDIEETDALNRANMIRLIELYSLHQISLMNFFQRFNTMNFDKKIVEMGIEKKNTYLKYMALDIQEMRPFLIKGFKPKKTIRKISNGIYISWQWNSVFSIGQVQAAFSESDIFEALSKNYFPLAVGVDYSGKFIDIEKTWINTDNYDKSNCETSLNINIAVLQIIHHILFSFYDKIDFDKICSIRNETVTISPELDDELFSLKCQQLAGLDLDNENISCVKPRIKMLRSQMLLNILANKFDCEVKKGKGSEITIYRKNEKKFRLGHHKKNNYINSYMIKNIINRLGITSTEWYEITEL